MPLFSQRRGAKAASKWHENVAALVRDTRPAPTTTSAAQFHQFPYAQLQAFTKEHLGKKKRTDAEQDQLLIDLISDHLCKEVAFAACVEHLSIGAAQDILDSSFRVDVNTSNGLEEYLHAFVATARWKESLGLGPDRTFALSLAPCVHTVLAHGIGPIVTRDLLTAWSLGEPRNRSLLLRAKAFTQKVLQQVDTELNAFETQLALGVINLTLYDRVFGYRNAFAAHHEPNESLSCCISCWRGWASWVPNAARLKGWASVPKGSAFSCLIEIEGPDLRVDGQQKYENEWSALIRGGHLLQWLESKGFTPGPGLITGDSHQLLISFINTFMECALDSVRKGKAPLLQYLINKNDLDSHTLRSWQAADSLLDPAFVALLLPKSVSNPDDSETIVLQGLQALATDITQSVRKPLGREVGACVQRTLENLLSVFKLSFLTSGDWAIFAGRLWMLRSSIASSGWLHCELDPIFVAMCTAQAPQHSLSVLVALHKGLTEADTGPGSILQNQFDLYVQSFVLQGSVTPGEMTGISHVLHGAWLYVQRTSFRDLTLLIASMQTLSTPDRLQCIRKLQGVSEDLIHGLQNCLISLHQDDVLEIINFTIIVGALGQDPCWLALFLDAVKNTNVRIDRSEFTALGYSGYRQCVEAVHDLVGGELDLVESTHSWLEELRSVETPLTSLEPDVDSYKAMHCILSEQQPEIRRRYLKMLQCYMKQTDKSRQTLQHELIVALRSTNNSTVPQAVMAISKVDSKGFSQCEDLMMICRKDSNVASARLAVWLKMSNLPDATEAALSSLSKVLNLGLDNDLNPPSASLEPTRKDYAKRVAELVARAQQLEKTRTLLARSDPNGVKALISELGLETPPSGIAALTANLPNGLMNVVNEVGDDEVELSFALSKDLNQMEHLAFGLKGTETMTVHLQLNERDKFDAFCVHIQNRGDSAIQRHNFYKAKSPPDRLFCEGTKLTRLTYVVARNLWRAVYEQGETSLQRLYEGIRAVVQASAKLCMVCGSNIGAQLHRATLCNNGQCKSTYLRTPLDLRLQDVRSNGLVVDLLLTSVFATANVNNLGLLPDCPSQLSDASKLQVLLNTLPPTSSLASSPDFTTGLRGCGQRAELLMSWLCTAFRGFIVPAFGTYKLPMNGIHQFLVVNNSPDTEAAFAVHNHHQQRQVLFHGTSMDRLYAILVQGLKICSHTPLQRHGAAAGAGIYTGREPGTASGYASATQTNNNFNGFWNSRVDFRNSSVILGLEHAGSEPGSSAVYVVKDPTKIMLRYIFIVPPHTNVPSAANVVPAMLSAFQSLKTAAAQRSADGASSRWSGERCSVMPSSPSTIFKNRRTSKAAKDDREPNPFKSRTFRRAPLTDESYGRRDYEYESSDDEYRDFIDRRFPRGRHHQSSGRVYRY